MDEAKIKKSTMFFAANIEFNGSIATTSVNGIDTTSVDNITTTNDDDYEHEMDKDAYDKR